jgi:hypothetical protein
LPHTLHQPRVLSFDYTLSLSDQVIFDSLLILGETLLDQLLDLRAATSYYGPLFVVCHSIGGLIFKQALCIANEHSRRDGGLLNSIAGVVLAGTPHKAASDSETLSRVLAIISSTSRAKKPLIVPDPRLYQEQSILWQLACRFESVNLRVPVLTTLETKKTKTREGLLKQKSLIVRRFLHPGQIRACY